MTKSFLALALLPLAAACTAGPPTQPALGAREARDLEKELAGKVPGKPVACIPSFDSSAMRVLGDSTVIYRVNKDLVYRGTLEWGCSGLSSGDALVMNRPMPTQYCRGDIARSMNLTNGTTSGSCAFGDFVPYRTAGK